MARRRNDAPTKTETATPSTKTRMADIAKLAGVSAPTVSRALNGSLLISAETRQRIVELAREHGYFTEKIFRKLRRARTNTVAVVADLPMGRGSRSPDSFTFDLIADISHALAVRDLDLLLFPRGATIDDYEQMYDAKGVDGIIFLGQGRQDAILRRLAASGAPMVAWGAVLGDSPYCTVGVDNISGGEQVGRHLAAARRTKVLFVGDLTYEQVAQRRAGLLKGLAGAASVTDLHVDGYGYDTAYKAVTALLGKSADRADAIFAASDSQAMAAIRALAEVGLSAPDDVRVVGYNDIPHAAYFNPPLTTVAQDTHQAGALLTEKLMQVLDGGRPRSVILPAELVVRAS